MEFIKNELIDEVLRKYFSTFSITLDTAEFVPAKYGKKIHKFIFKNMKQKFRAINRAYKRAIKQKKKTGGTAISLQAVPPVATDKGGG